MKKLDKKTTEINAIIASKREQLEIVEKYLYYDNKNKIYNKKLKF